MFRNSAVVPGGKPAASNQSAMSWDCGLRYMFSVSPGLHHGNKSNLHDKEDLSRLEMVQRLAKDGCRFLQNHSKNPERTSEVRYMTHRQTEQIFLQLLFVAACKCIETKTQL